MELTSNRRWLALAAICLTSLVIGLDTTVLNIALPTLAGDLHASTSALQWFTSGYTLALAALMLPMGAYADRFGRKRFLLGSLVVFGAASAWCAYAGGPGQLIAARVALGVGAAALMPLTLAVISVIFPEPVERRRAIGINMTGVALGMPLGPLLGGWMLEHFWWGSVFLINVPVVVLALAAVTVLVPESRSAVRRSVHLPSVVLSSAGLASLTYGFIRIGETSWGNLVSWACITGGALVLAIFVRWQRGLQHPLIDMSLFANPAFRWGTVYSVILSFAMFGIFFSVPQYFQAVLGVDSFGSGLRMLPMIGGILVATRLADRLTTRGGVRTTLMVGFALVVAGMSLGAFTQVGTSYAYTAAWLVVMGVGMGIVMLAAMGWATSALDAERSGSGAALLSALRQAGGTIGIAVLGTVQATRYHSELGSLDHGPVHDSVTGGVSVAQRLGDPAMLHQVQSAFVSSMGVLLWVCAAIAAVSFVIVRVTTRRTTPAPLETTTDAAESLHAV
ncbi:MFS transporter [Luteipulveratus mongoliensis]|uniref:Multidrug MFS transporter n=1 Tax=Luteipulveratus mongoliensis TaxID=571913 RepID=A0A0K1JE33_9MICO|nr:MFS transporter [Luteipulveratus mongoliensis]AKU14966.1 multidrug MFS transporter [Luteipulveratus mongoliensis]